MLRSYLTLALRTLRRRKGYTAVNVLGLTVGLACCALVAVFLQYELSYDTHHDDADRIYRILSSRDGDTFSSIRFKNFFGTEGADQPLLAERLSNAIPAVEQAALFEILTGPVFVRTPSGDAFTSERRLVTNTGPAFADLFTFERVAGAPLAEALAEPNTAVLTRSTARLYFGGENPVGRTLEVGSQEMTVRSVIADPPANSQLTFDFALSVERVPNWAAYHYVRLADGADPAVVAPLVTQLMDDLFPDRAERSDGFTERLQALTEIHLAERALYDDTPHRNPAYLWTFGAIGLLILLITTVNYTNLALALHAGRNTEIGVRKALGGHRWQIAGQFLTEALLLSLLCVPLALAACSLVLPSFNRLMGTGIARSQLLQPAILGAAVGLAVLTGLVVGAHPALVLARRRTVDLFGRPFSSAGRRAWSLRYSLIALQFVVLIGLGSLSWVVYDQLRFMQAGDLGYETEHVVRTNFSADSSQYQLLRRELLTSPAIQHVGMGLQPRPPANRTPFRIYGEEAVYSAATLRQVDVYWFDVMGIEHPALEAMKREGPGAPNRALINETATREVRTGDPVGKVWQFANGNPDAPLYPIDGVIRDLHINPMREAVVPTIYQISARPSYGYNILVRLTPGRTQDGLEHIRAVGAALFPDTPQQLTFLSERLAELYRQEQRFGMLAGALSVLAIVLAALGLASLVAYLTRLRMKEIGIRKAMGGTTTSVVALLNREYVRIVGAAFLIGAPLAWLAAMWWLEQFAYRVDISLVVFGTVGLGALGVATLAVSTQALRIARINPADVLRDN